MATQLRHLYLSVHALSWLDIPPGDARRHLRQQDQFDGRVEMGMAIENVLKERYERLVDGTADDEGMYMLPTRLPAPDAFIDYAQERMGPRAVRSRAEGGAEVYERLFGPEFFEELEQDQREAIRRRGLPDGFLTADQLRRGEADRGHRPELPAGGLNQTEIRGWMSAKAWARDLCEQFEVNGLAFDPATVKAEAFGGDWSYCAGSYPVQIGRALGLASPIERRFDLINPSEGPLLMRSTLVDQNLPMPANIRLFIWDYADSEGSRYVAQFWEGLRGIMDPPHQVSVEIPCGAASEVNLWGMGLGRAVGLDELRRDRLTLSVGSGGHTPIKASLVMTRDDMPLDDFRAALLAGEVSEAG